LPVNNFLAVKKKVVFGFHTTLEYEGMMMENEAKKIKHGNMKSVISKWPVPLGQASHW
jgi:hypothetical protein